MDFFFHYYFIYYLQSQWASSVLVQHYMANENFIQVGSRMMPYALDRQDNDEQIKREKGGKMNMTGGAIRKHSEPPAKLSFQRTDKKRGRAACCGRTYTVHVLQCSISLFPYLHLSVSIYDSLTLFPLIKYSQLVPLNIHRAALLRLSALCQSASSECTRSPPKA